MTFSKDIVGNALNYRILVQENKIKAILYNFKGKIRELKFTEFQFRKGEVVNVKRLGLPGVSLATIEDIPIQTLAAVDPEQLNKYECSPPHYELTSVCKTRFFEELMGYVDVQLIPDCVDKPSQLKSISPPICELEKDFKGAEKVEAIFAQWKANTNSKCLKICNQIKEEIASFNGGSLNLEQKKALLENLQKIDAEVTVIPEDDLSEEQSEQLKELLKESAVVQRKLAVDIRVSALHQQLNSFH